MQYWLLKSEPSTYSIDDLKKDKISPWEGVRNYQARNFMRDEMQVGDLAFFYHSSCKEPGIVGIASVAKTSYPDFTSWNMESDYYDPKSTQKNPRWFMVDIKFKEKFSDIITLSELRENTAIEDLALLRKGNRLSIMPVTAKQWQQILTMKA